MIEDPHLDEFLHDYVSLGFTLGELNHKLKRLIPPGLQIVSDDGSFKGLASKL